ncbi:Arc family DNA-binding protein [Arsenophonus sp.]
MRKPQVNIRMPDDLRKKLKLIAKNKDRSVNYIVVQVLKEYVVKNTEATANSDSHGL